MAYFRCDSGGGTPTTFTITTFTGGPNSSTSGHTKISLSNFKKLYKYVKCTSRSAQYVGWDIVRNDISANVDYEIANRSNIGITTVSNSGSGGAYSGNCTFVFHN